MTDTTGHELSVTRLIDAPMDAIWRAWTDHLGEWWCPKPWRAEVVELDLRAGGRFATTMYGPEGEVSPNEGVILEVIPGERIIFTDAFKPGWVPAGPFMVGLFLFAQEGNKVRCTASARHWNAETMAQHAEMGFAEGWGTVLAQMEAVAQRLATR